ncbi:hypothetical protein [Nocardia thailandica]|uniref:hypothetical protein n=1 Tax=Nocardia thailandica TaxID=257275 RepID=UPI0005BBF201|nr:hypothetical protein [Nocardia thailandica]
MSTDRIILEHAIRDVPPFEVQARILELIATRLLVVAPYGWQRLELRYTKIGENDFEGCDVWVHLVSGSLPIPWKATDEVADLFDDLKHYMAHPQRGTWLEVEYTQHFPNQHSIRYLRGAEELEGVAAEDIVRELEIYPRSDEFVPEWMTKLRDSCHQ